MACRELAYPLRQSLITRSAQNIGVGDCLPCFLRAKLNCSVCAFILVYAKIGLDDRRMLRVLASRILFITIPIFHQIVFLQRQRKGKRRGAVLFGGASLLTAGLDIDCPEAQALSIVLFMLSHLD